MDGQEDHAPVARRAHPGRVPLGADTAEQRSEELADLPVRARGTAAAPPAAPGRYRADARHRRWEAIRQEGLDLRAQVGRRAHDGVDRRRAAEAALPAPPR